MSFKTLDDLGDLTGKTVLVREDLNVPMADGVVTDDTRLRATVATLCELADKGAKVLVCNDYELAIVRESDPVQQEMIWLRLRNTSRTSGFTIRSR